MDEGTAGTTVMTRTVPIAAVGRDATTDLVAVEEPLELRLTFGPAANRSRVTLAVTMRTPGHDADLAAGFLLSEAVIRTGTDVLEIRQVEANAVRIDLHPDTPFDADRTRRFSITSACGVCGTRTLDDLDRRTDPVPVRTTFTPQVIHQLPELFRTAQPTFDQTGGLHAAGLFDVAGTLLGVREDVGRHNAVDKLVGAEMLVGRLPLSGKLIFVSGRAGFELVQKAVAAGAEVLAAVGAPTSLAVDAAERFGVTLLGFVREGRFNCYAGKERLGERPV